MRKEAFLMIFLVGCTTAPLERQSSTANAATDAAAESKLLEGNARIIIGAQSNLCVNLRIDPRLWPRPLLPNADHDFSNSFAAALDRFHEESGTSRLPGPRRLPRIVTKDRRIDPLCERDTQDIYISAAYVLRSDGTPFRFTYRIEQGPIVLSGAVERDIQDEWRTGKLVKLGHVPLEDAIVRDFPERARLIHSLIQP